MLVRALVFLLVLTVVPAATLQVAVALDPSDLLPAFEDGQLPPAMFGSRQGEDAHHAAGIGALATTVASYDAMRALAGRKGMTIALSQIRQAGTFLFSSTDPHGFGDDGGIVIRAANGWWLRQFAYDQSHPIELDWFETVFPGADIAPALGRIAWSFADFYVRVPSRPMTLYSSYLDFERGGSNPISVAGNDFGLEVRNGIQTVTSPSGDFIAAGLRPGMRIRLEGFSSVYNNRVTTIAADGMTRHRIRLTDATRVGDKARAAKVTEVRPPGRFALLESDTPVVIRQKPPYLEFEELHWTRERAVPGGFVYRAPLPWPTTQILADLGDGVADLGPPSPAVGFAGQWQYDPGTASLVVALPAPPADGLSGRAVVDGTGMDLRGLHWTRVQGQIWQAKGLPRAPSQLFAFHPAVQRAVNFGVSRTVKSLGGVKNEWEWYYDRLTGMLRVRFPDGVKDPNGKEGFALYHDGDITKMWRLPWQRDVTVGGPKHLLTFKGTYRHYGDRLRYTGGLWRSAPDGTFFAIESAATFIGIVRGSRARVHVNIEGVFNGGIDPKGFELVEASGVVRDRNGVGARYVSHLHYGRIGDLDVAYKLVNDTPVELDSEGHVEDIPGYGARTNMGGGGIGVAKVTGRFETQFSDAGVGGFGVTFGESEEKPLDVVFVDPFKRRVAGGGTVDAKGRRYGDAAKVDGAGSSDSFLRLTEINTDAVIGGESMNLLALEATADAAKETKINAGLHLELVGVRHPILLNRTEDTGDCQLDFYNPDPDERHTCADVSQFSTVVGTTYGRIIAQDHDRLGMPDDPLTVGFVTIKSQVRWTYRPKYHAVGVVIDHATFPQTTPDGRTLEGPRILVDNGAGYGEERWAPPPARVSGSDIRIGRVERGWALLSDHTNFLKAGFASGRPVLVQGTRRHDGEYIVATDPRYGVQEHVLLLQSPPRLMSEEPAGSPVTVYQPNIVNGRLHMTGMRFVKKAKPLIIRSTAPEHLSFRVTGVGPDGEQAEQSLAMRGTEVTSGYRWNQIKEIAITSGQPVGDLRAGLDAPIVLRDVTFTGASPQHLMHITNEKRPDVPVYVEINDMSAPTGSTITADDATNVHVRVDGVEIDHFPYVFGRDHNRAAAD